MNEQNLKPVRSESEARELGKKGGIASGESRRKRRMIRDTLQILLDSKDDKNQTGWERLAFGLFNRACSGDPKAVELIAAYLGEGKGPTNAEFMAERSLFV